MEIEQSQSSVSFYSGPLEREMQLSKKKLFAQNDPRQSFCSKLGTEVFKGRGNKSTTWTHTGYVNMHSFLGDSQKHEKAKSYMKAYKMWKTFGRDAHESVDVLFSRARREAVERHNEEVRQNREMLKNITEAVLYLAKQELAFRGHDESSCSLNQGDYREPLYSIFFNIQYSIFFNILLYSIFFNILLLVS